MTNIVSIINGEALTTSLAIAEGVGNPHKAVIQLIRQNIGDIEDFGPLAFEMRVVNRPQGGGAKQEYALLNEQQATLLMTYMRNSEVVKKFKKQLVRSFYELAKKKEVPQNLSRMEILQMAIESESEKLALKFEVEELKPKADFHDRVIIAEDSISIGKAAKVLGTGRNRLLTFLRQIKWVSRRNEPYQDKIESGYMDVKLGSFNHPEHGLSQSITSLVTGKGLVELQRIYREQERAA